MALVEKEFLGGKAGKSGLDADERLEIAKLAAAV
jgi:hypothetical protein